MHKVFRGVMFLSCRTVIIVKCRYDATLCNVFLLYTFECKRRYLLRRGTEALFVRMIRQMRLGRGLA